MIQLGESHMGRAQNIGKKAVRAANSIVNIAVLCIALLLIAFGCYALWDSNQVYDAASAARYEIYKPRIEDEGRSFAELQEINPEVFAWLTVYGTNIDYPVTQGEDNMKYVNTNAEGGFSLSGSIFLDCGNRKDFTDFNSIFYGHHMEKEAMFGEIGLFSDRNYFSARQYGNLYYDGKDHGLEFFAFLHADAYDASIFTPAVKGGEMQQVYLNNLLAKATYTREAVATAQDRIVLLSTCSPDSTNGRSILVGRITDEHYEDIFITEETNNTGMYATVDGQQAAPLWLWLLIAAALMVILIIVFYNKRRRRTDTKNRYK